MAKEVKKGLNSKGSAGVWWIHGLLALLALGLSYVFASLAIDSGSLLQYAVCIALIYWGFSNLLRALRMTIAK